jgi:hypothetical protein
VIKLKKTDVFGWEAAIRGMRNPLNSWDKSDSGWVIVDEEYDITRVRYQIGKNDLTLMKKLAQAGSDHAKFLRMINVTVDVTAPLYWWKEYDTYKVGTVANSCSTMHKIHEKEFTLDDFSHEHLGKDEIIVGTNCNVAIGCLRQTINVLNTARTWYLETKDKRYWRQMIQLLPSSYNQKRTVQLNYQVLKSMYHARKTHKLDEWKEFCKWCETLPYFNKVCISAEKGR